MDRGESGDCAYNVRSALAHGHYLFQLDEAPWSLNWEAMIARAGDDEIYRSAIRVAKTGLRNCLSAIHVRRHACAMAEFDQRGLWQGFSSKPHTNLELAVFHGFLPLDLAKSPAMGMPAIKPARVILNGTRA